MKSITRIPSAVLSSAIEFLRPYDDEISKNSLGLPVLKGWQGVDPYEDFVSGERSSSHSKPYGAIVITSGNEVGTWHYLDRDELSMGTFCTADIVIHSESFSEAGAYFKFKNGSLKVSSDHPLHPIEVNQEESDSIEVFDQDELTFLGVDFIYVQFA